MKKRNPHPHLANKPAPLGILLVNKPKEKTAFNLVAQLRRLLGVEKIGHAGTLDPFATGVMVMLIGREWTRKSDSFLCADKEYIGTIRLGETTDTYDCDGEVTQRSDRIPTLQEVEKALESFQGEIFQVPPMFSAKKVNGKKLYELARKGQEIPREPVKVSLTTKLCSYNYPEIKISVICSKGTYIRSIAYDLGVMLGCGAHLVQLQRVRSGSFHLADCFEGAELYSPLIDMESLCNAIRGNMAAQC